MTGRVYIYESTVDTASLAVDGNFREFSVGSIVTFGLCLVLARVTIGFPSEVESFPKNEEQVTLGTWAFDKLKVSRNVRQAELLKSIQVDSCRMKWSVFPARQKTRVSK